jgi:hypothetical protein
MIRLGFKCSCGASEKLAIVGRCTECKNEILIVDAEKVVTK